MRTISAMVQIAALAVVISCGASSAELNKARSTTYNGPPATLFAAAQQVSEATYKTASSDPSLLTFQTEALWYNPDGQLDTTTGNNISRLQEDSINLQLAVQVTKAAGDTYRVEVTSLIKRKHGLTSLPETVDPEDPSLPGWVGGKGRALQLAIHDKLAPYSTASGATSGPKTAPAGSAAPAAMPATGSDAPAPAPAP